MRFSGGGHKQSGGTLAHGSGAGARRPANALEGWALLGLIYFALAWLAIELARNGAPVATLWYANGAAVGMLAVGRLALLPGLLSIGMANGLANLAAGDTLLDALAFALPNLLEVGLGAWWLHLDDDAELAHRDGFALCRSLAKGVLLPALAGATLGGWLIASLGRAGFAEVWVHWYAGTAVGGCAVLPLAQRCARLGVPRFWRSLSLEAAAWCALAIAVSIAVLSHLPFPFVYILAPLSMLAMREGFNASALGVLLTSITMSWLAARGLALPLSGKAHWDALLVSLPVLLTLLPPLLLAALTEQRREALRQLAEREQRSRELYARTPAMLGSIDPQGGLLSVSDTWLGKLGYQAQEVIGIDHTQFMSEASRAQARAVVMPELFRTGQCDGIALQWRRRDGQLLEGLLSARVERDAHGAALRALLVIEDVTDRNRLAAELAATELFAVTLDAIADAVLSTDAQGRIEMLNPVAEQLLGVTRERAHGRPFAQLVQLLDLQSDAALPDPLQRCLAGAGEVVKTSARLVRADGAPCVVQLSFSPIIDRAGAKRGVVMVFQDVTHARQLAEQMHHLAQHDALTDLPNRLLLRDRIEQRCQSAQREGESFAVLMFDLDHFKHVNDSLGHAAGDELLRTVAQRALQTVRQSDTVCRLGGDEFVLLLDRIGSGESAADVARKLLAALARPVRLPGGQAEVSASVGIALYPRDGRDEQTLLRQADAALYRAKRDGRNRFHFYSPEMDQAATQRLQREQELRNAMAEGRFELHYQPVLTDVQHALCGMEVLLRLRSDGKLLPPASFIEVAEECRLIRPLGLWVLRSACEQYGVWQQAGLAPGYLAVNVSGVQLEDPKFAAQVKRILRETRMPPERLQLEITESTLLRGGGHVLRRLSPLRRLGVKVSLDDFGTGYSSLSHLRRLPVDTIKIDRSFVRDLVGDQVDQHIVLAIISLARGLGLRVVAEGVETAAQASALQALGQTDFQGYWLARPLASDEMGDWLRERAQAGTALA